MKNKKTIDFILNFTIFPIIPYFPTLDIPYFRDLRPCGCKDLLELNIPYNRANLCRPLLYELVLCMREFDEAIRADADALQALRDAFVVQTCLLMKAGFPDRIPFDEALETFACLRPRGAPPVRRPARAPPAAYCSAYCPIAQPRARTGRRARRGRRRVWGR